MHIRLQPLRDDELGLLLALLRTRFDPVPKRLGNKLILEPAPLRPIRRLARKFADYARDNRNKYFVADSVEWVRRGKHTHVAAGVDKREVVDRLTRDQWRRMRDEMRRILKESKKIEWWGFRLPVVLPSKKVFIFRPEDLVLNWLTARLIANGQQFRLVPRCQQCGKAGLRARARRQNIYCSDECKQKAIAAHRRAERALRQLKQEDEIEEASVESVRVVRQTVRGPRTLSKGG